MNYRYDTVVIGGGQAGLAMGHYLARQNRDFVILDGGRSVGEAWRDRWDSLRLFTPAQHSSLPGLPFPAPHDHYPGRDEVADYLAAYAGHFDLPVRLRERVVSLQANDDGDGYLIETPGEAYRARNVVVATGPFGAPNIPALSRLLSPDVLQLHSTSYRRPEQIPDGNVIVVGAGTSGIQIAAELAASRKTYLSVGSPITRLPARLFGRSIFTWLERSGALDVTIDSRLGRRASRREIAPERSPRTIARTHGVELLERVVAGEEGRLRTASGRAVEISSVIWATGFRSSYPWIDLRVFDEKGKPVHRRGVTAAPGLYFLGLPWLHTRGSALLGWVGRDAAYLSDVISATSPVRSAPASSRSRHAVPMELSSSSRMTISAGHRHIW